MTTTPEHAPTADGPDLVDVRMHVVRPTEPVVGIVTRNEICTGPKHANFVRHIELDVAGTPLAGSFRAGQAFGVLAPGLDEHNKPHKLRLYSFACPSTGEDGSGAIISTTVKRVIDEHWDDHSLFLGVASNYLCDLQVGDEVRVTGPSGKRFVLPARPDEHDYLFFATGTGIAPFRGMVHELLARGVSSKIVLMMGSSYTTDLLYDDDFRKLEQAHDNLTYLTAISRQPQPDGSLGLYVQNRLDTHKSDLLPLLASGRGLIYVCGIAGMELGIFKTLARILDPQTLQHYLTLDETIAHDPASWNRRMIPKKIRPTRRVFLEVYA